MERQFTISDYDFQLLIDSLRSTSSIIHQVNGFTDPKLERLKDLRSSLLKQFDNQI